MDHAERARTLLARDYLTPTIDHALLALQTASQDQKLELRAIIGIALQRKSMNAAAMRYLDGVLEDNPSHARVLAHRGIAHDRLYRKPQAQQDLKRSVELDPEYSLAWEELAYISYDLQDAATLDEAIANLERLGKVPGALYRLRGKRALDAGDSTAGVADLRAGARNGDPMAAFHLDEAGIEFETGDERALFGLDRAKRRMIAPAIGCYEQAIAQGFSDPDRDAKVTRNLAGLLSDEGRKDDALAVVVALTERSPDRADSWLTRAGVDNRMESFAKAYELSPEQGTLPLARKLMAADRLGEARDKCNEQLARDPDDKDAHRLLGEIELAAGANEGAKRAFLAAEALGDQQAGKLRARAFGSEIGLDHFETALNLLDQRNKTGAIAEFDKAVELLRTETKVAGDEAHRYLAKCLYNSAFLRELKVPDEDIEPNIREALELDPTYTDAMLSLGNLCLRTDRIDEGLAWFAKAGQIDPSAGQGWYYRARHFNQLGDDEQAIEDATKAFDAYRRRNQARFAADAVMMRGQCNENLGNLQEAKRDYDLAYDWGHPTGFAHGDNIRQRIAIEDSSSPEWMDYNQKVIERIEAGECPWAEIDFLHHRIQGNDEASKLVDKLTSDQALTDAEKTQLVEFLL